MPLLSESLYDSRQPSDDSPLPPHDRQVPLDSYIALEREMALVYDPKGEMPADEPVQIAHKLLMDVPKRGV